MSAPHGPWDVHKRRLAHHLNRTRDALAAIDGEARQAVADHIAANPSPMPASPPVAAHETTEAPQ